MEVEPVTTKPATLVGLSTINVSLTPFRSTRSIHDLPTELLERILQLSVPPHAPRPYLIKHTVKLRRVCKYWQRIIDGCPTLWSEVTFEGGLALLSQSLTNSKDAALTIKCSLGLGSPARDFKSMKMVLEHAKRWKSLDITIWIKNHVDVAAYLPLEAEGGAPILSDMKMFNTVITPDTAGLISADKFPRLKSLQLVDVTLGGGFGSLPQLEELSLIDVKGPENGRFDVDVAPGFPIPKLREVLLSCSASLKSLRLHGEFPHLDQAARPRRQRTQEEREKEREPITLPNLQKLGIFHCQGETAFGILSIVDASECKGLKVFAEEFSGPSRSASLPRWMFGRNSSDDDDHDDGSSSSSSAGWTSTVTRVIQKLDPSSSVLEFELQENGFSIRSSNNSITNTNNGLATSSTDPPPFVEIILRPRQNDGDNDQSVRPPLHPTPPHHAGDPASPLSNPPSSPSFDLPPWALSSSRHHHRYRHPLFTILQHLLIQSTRSRSPIEGECEESGRHLLHVPARLKYKDGKEPSWGEDFLSVLRMVVSVPLCVEGLGGEKGGRGGEESGQ
ncbi:hypothetical protein FRC04_010179 [Tulasnella sp. 424]|nr:hypothetical protein FRC04_010179 [Tulasnella sp. 424]